MKKREGARVELKKTRGGEHRPEKREHGRGPKQSFHLLFFVCASITQAPPSFFSIPPSHPRAFSFRDLHPSIMCRNMPFSSLENTQHFIIMPKSKKRKPHTQVSVQCLHCKQIFKKASLWEDGRVHSQGLSVHLGHKSKITCHECHNQNGLFPLVRGKANF